MFQQFSAEKDFQVFCSIEFCANRSFEGGGWRWHKFGKNGKRNKKNFYLKKKRLYFFTFIIALNYGDNVFKCAILGLFLFLFSSFPKNITFFAVNICENGHQVYGAGIRTHDLQNMSLLLTTRPGLPPKRGQNVW